MTIPARLVSKNNFVHMWNGALGQSMASGSGSYLTISTAVEALPPFATYQGTPGIRIEAGGGGLYTIHGQAQFPNNGNGFRLVALYLDSPFTVLAEFVLTPRAGIAPFTVNVNTIVKLADLAIVKLFAAHDAGVNLSVVGILRMARIGY